MTSVISITAARVPTGAGSPVSIHGLPAFRRIAKGLSTMQVQTLSVEQFRAAPGVDAVALWDFGSVAVLPRDVERGVRGRIVAWSLESPLVAHRGYHRLPKIGSKAAHVIGFPGVGGLLGNGARAKFHPVGWPNERRTAVTGDAWDARRWLTMVNSNKRLHQWRESFSSSDARGYLRVLASSLVARSYSLRPTWTVPDLYETRMDMLRHFSGESDFALYGVGWDERLPGRPRELHDRILKSFEGSPASKHEVLKDFRFCLCIENTAFPGYISEKLFDCFFAGAIPVYLGAPDVHEYVPPDSFIDLREFDDYELLSRRLRSMTPKEAHDMRKVAREFIASASFVPFTAQYFETRIIEAITDVLAGARVGSGQETS